MNQNPFQSPKIEPASGDATASQGVWRDGRYAVARQSVAKFPIRCLVCGNADNCRPLLCKIRKRPGVLQVLVPITGVFSRSIIIRVNVCNRHRKEELLSRWLGHAIVLFAAAIFITPIIVFTLVPSAPREIAMIMPLAVVVGWVWVYYRIFRPRIAWADFIDDHDVWIENVHKSVLLLLPPVPDESKS